MKINEADGVFYCQDCGTCILDPKLEHESIEYCPKCARRRGWNIIDRRPVRVTDENEDGQKA
jgi:hypothetical protein